MNQQIFEDPILTIPEIARYLQISRSKAYYMAYKKQLPILRLGRNIHVRMSDLMKWLDQRIEKPI